MASKHSTKLASQLWCLETTKHLEMIPELAEEITDLIDLYIDGKKVAEELRALSLEFNVPIVTATQINREGSKMELKEIDHNYTADSSGIPATSDLMVFLGDDDDLFTYENEIHWKIIKNRIGGRVGDIKKFYIDTRSLKMYCETEYDEWIDDVKTSNDSRDVKANIS